MNKVMKKHHVVLNFVLAVLMIAGMMLSVIQRPVVAAASGAQVGESTGPGAVVSWNAIALRTSIGVAGQNQPQAQMYLARVQAAVYNAVVAIAGRYQPYQSKLAPRPGASIDAAVATAAHAVLVHDFPNQQSALDDDLAAALAAIPDGAAETAGVEVGEQAAAELIALRAGDGLEADIGFVMPQPAPGVWQLPQGAAPLSPWISQLRPYMLAGPDQFRPGPPPALGSLEWAKEYEEVRRIGQRDSISRTPRQTDVARFWTMHAPVQFNTTYQQIALDPTRGLDAVEAARLFAMGNLASADALIACFDAKFTYLFWRPQYAIPGADYDGNPATTSDPTWQPLLGTPPHPEYPSAHSCLTSANAEVFAAFLGTQQIELDITSTVPDLLYPTRHYSYAKDLVREIVNARVWGGIHYRGSDITGADLGHRVTLWALQRYFQPVP